MKKKYIRKKEKLKVRTHKSVGFSLRGQRYKTLVPLLQMFSHIFSTTVLLYKRTWILQNRHKNIHRIQNHRIAENCRSSSTLPFSTPLAQNLQQVALDSIQLGFEYF